MPSRLLKSPGIRRIVMLLVLVAVALVYAPRLADSFLSDDFYYLRIYEYFEGSAGGFSADWWNVMVGGLNFHFRPVFGVTGWALHQIGGLNPLWWHLANLALHLGSVLLVVGLTRRVVDGYWTGIGAGLLFGLHFIHAESVVWISARTSLLAAFFVLAAVVWESAPRRRVWGWQRHAGIACACLALLSKENAIALPMLLLLVPREPYRLTDAVVHSAPARCWPRLLAVRLLRQWPYWALTLGFIVMRFGAIAASARGTVYRIEAGLNVVKNAGFVIVSSLFPLDFRAGLGAWNRWYLDHDWYALAGWTLGHPGVVIGVIVASLFWMVALSTGPPAVRRLAGWMIVAALPTLFFRGTGERLMYLGCAGSSAAIVVMLAGWHEAFVVGFRRAGRYLSPALFVALLAFNVHWLQAKLTDWESASILTETIIAQLREVGTAIPPDATVRFEGLPDNIDGAWVFRLGIEDAFMLYADRPDVTLARRAMTGPDSHDLVYRWDGAVFAR